MHRVWGRRMLNHFEEYFFFGGVGGAVLCSMQGLSFLTRDQPVPSALGARSLNHWTARDVPLRNTLGANMPGADRPEWGGGDRPE